jgi:hypothetical protein
MAGVLVTLVHPTTRADGSAFNPATDLKNVILEEQAQGATTWTAVGAPMLPTELTRTVQNVPGGAWNFRATWVDTSNRSSAPAQATISVPIGAPNAGTITLSLV